MQAPLPAAPQQRPLWQHLKTVDLTGDSEYLEITWEEFAQQYDEFKLCCNVLDIGRNESGAPLYMGYRIKYKQVLSSGSAYDGTPTWWSSNHLWEWITKNETSAETSSGSSTGGYANTGKVGYSFWTGTPSWRADAYIEYHIPGKQQRQPHVTWDMRNKHGSTMTGKFQMYHGNTYSPNHNYIVIGGRMKLSKSSYLSDQQYFKEDSQCSLYGLRH